MKLLMVRYKCGWEYPVPLLPGQAPSTVSPQVRRAVRKRHRLDCEVCGLTPTARGDNPDQRSSDPSRSSPTD